MSRTFSRSSKNNIKQEVAYSDITFDKLYAADFQKEGTLTAQIRQVVSTMSSYPSKQVSSNKQNNLFAQEEFGFGTQDFTSNETRVAWILVPTDTEEKEIIARLEAANAQGATIYKVLSNHPILDNNQKRAVDIGLGDVTLDTFANSQVVRFPEGHPQAGQLCLDANGKVQYRRTYFWLTSLDDQDMRSAEPADVYMSPEIKSELEVVSTSIVTPSITEGQTL